MATTNASRSLDGTTVTITLTAEHAQFAAAGVGYLIGSALLDYGNTWNHPAPLTIEILDQHVAGLQAITDHYRPVLEQLERQHVIDIWTALMTAYRQACEQAGVKHLDGMPPAAAPTTGEVTLTWSTTELELLIEFLTDADAQKENPEFIPAGVSIREQLEDAA